MYLQLSTYIYDTYGDVILNYLEVNTRKIMTLYDAIFLIDLLFDQMKETGEGSAQTNNYPPLYANW